MSPPPPRDWRHYAAPAAFLLAATIAILLIRSGLQSSSSPAPAPPPSVHATTAQATTTGPKPKTKFATRFYTVVAGDTFGAISTKTGVSVADIQRLNPTASTTSLHIGQKLRLR